METKPKIGFAGLTHLGINSAIAAAEKGFQVIGFHDSSDLISDLANGKPPITEPQLIQKLNSYKEQIKFVDNPQYLSSCDIIYLSVDVPTSKNGTSNLNSIHKMIEKIKEIINKNTIFIILCQVPPGFTRKLKLKTKHIFYQVETLVFCDAINRAINPERIIIGCMNKNKALDKRLKVFLSSFNCPILPMSYESAELSKISINLFLVSSVTIANTLAEVCENIGADWDEIIPALRLDKRIGRHAYIKAGLGISGGNLERDMQTIVRLGQSYKTDINSIKSFLFNSKHRKNWIWETMQKVMDVKKENLKISILGLAYKENTNSIKNSPSLKLISYLSNFSVLVHDPAVKDDLPCFVERKETVNQCINGCDLLIIATPWDEYRNLRISEIKKKMKGRIIIDPYRVVDGDLARQEGFSWYSIGQKFIKK